MSLSFTSIYTELPIILRPDIGHLFFLCFHPLQGGSTEEFKGSSERHKRKYHSFKYAPWMWSTIQLEEWRAVAYAQRTFCAIRSCLRAIATNATYYRMERTKLTTALHLVRLNSNCTFSKISEGPLSHCWTLYRKTSDMTDDERYIITGRRKNDTRIIRFRPFRDSSGDGRIRTHDLRFQRRAHTLTIPLQLRFWRFV